MGIRLARHIKSVSDRVKQFYRFISIVLLSAAAIGSWAGEGPTAEGVDRPLTLATQEGQLQTIPVRNDQEKAIQGWVIIGHEVRSFRPCDSDDDLWLMGSSPALKAIVAAYRQAFPEQRDYRPLLMELVGKRVPPPVHGFGADYEGAFLATRLVRVSPEASCGTSSDPTDSGKTVGQKIAFDISALDNEGLLGPPGGKES